MKHTLILFKRYARHITRSPDTLITVLFMPVAMMLMFTFVFGGAITKSIGEGVNYVSYQLPGILLITIASGISYVSIRLFTDIQKGLFARFCSMPIARGAFLWANVLISLVSNLISVVCVFLIALVMGFRSSAGILEWLAAAGILVLFTLALTWVAVIPGLTAKSVESSYLYSYPLIFLPYLSSAFVPTETMPSALRWFAEHQPVTSIVETIRGLLGGGAVGNEIWVALAWCAGITVAAYLFAMRAYRRRVV
jgi:ABC-2 type transport system permease protein